jgi:hypothetical protein
MDQTVIEVIGKMHASEQLCLMHQSLSSRGDNIIAFPLWTEESIEKILRKSQIDLDVGLNGEGTQVIREQPENEVSLLPLKSRILGRGASR